MLLDAGSTVYLWVGTGANAGERKRAMSLAEEYVGGLGAVDGRPAEVPVVRVQPGGEPPHFRAQFHGWSDAKAAPGYDAYEARLQAAGAVRRAKR